MKNKHKHMYWDGSKDKTHKNHAYYTQGKNGKVWLKTKKGYKLTKRSSL